MAERSPLSEPRSRRRRLLPKVTLDSEAFGEFAEAAARFMGTGKFIAYMTVFVGAWVIFNVVGIYGFSWDPYPFILLNLFFSTQASYSAPLILLAQNRQEVRDKLSLDEDRRLAAQSRADMDFLAREIAAIRMHLGELATRDFVRSELRSELRELTERLEQAVNEKRGGTMSETQQISWYSVVLLAGHLVMAGVATWSLWVLGSGLWVGAGAVLLLLIAYGFLWRFRMAPAAQNRFTYRQRLTVHLILGPAVVVLAVLTSIWLPALVGVSLALLGDALASRADSKGLETD